MKPFQRLFRAVGLKVLDVGARSGALPWMLPLAPYADFHACEPAEDGREPLAALLAQQAPWRAVKVIGEAIAGGGPTLTLNVTRHSGFTSALVPDPALARAFGLEAEMQVTGQVQVPALGLQAAAERYGFEDLALLKIDIQGGELDALRSGEALLRGPVQAVYLEAEFRPFYRGQPLFSEVELYLRGCGFELVALEPVHKRRGDFAGLGYSRHEPVWAHALFFKPADEGFKLTGRQIAIAMAAEQFDLAAERLLQPGFQAQLSERGLRLGLEQLVAYVKAAMPGGQYETVSATWPRQVKTTPKPLTRAR